MSYTPPAPDAVDFSWVGEGAYAPPPHDAVNFSWAPSTAIGRLSVPSPLGVPALLGRPVVVGRVAVPTPLGAPALVGGVLAQTITGAVAAPGPLGAPAVLGRAVVLARASALSPLGAPAVVGAVVVRGLVAAPSPLGVPAVLGTVLRYEIRGAVRQGGVALVRRVRSYRLSDGALLGEADTVLGKYRVPAGLVAGELCYVVPLDMSLGATDYRPVAANRVAAVLADDTAEIAA